jgi:membrane protease YdiL (CAAX protease family)
MGKITLGGVVTPRDLGIGADRRDAFAALIALVAGAALAFFPLVPLLRDATGLQTLHGVFAGLIVASTAEVLLFLGVLDAAIQALFARDDWKAKATTVVVSSVAFGLFHFTYPEPWDTISMAAMLGGIWVMTSLLFVLSRSLLAAILFDNLMATTGFVKNSLSLPLPAIYGWLLAAFALAVFVVVFRFARR